MNKIIRIASLLVCFLGSVYCQPKLSLNNLEIDLGTIYSGMKKQGKIVISNTGNDTLRIFAVQPSCGCTTVKQPKSVLLPFESDIVEVEFNSSGYSGKVIKHISVVTNDPLSPSVAVKLTADVKTELEPLNHSSLLWLGNVMIGKTFGQPTSLINVSNHKIKIKTVTASSPSITVAWTKQVLDPNDTLTVQVTVKPEKLGYGSDHFTIETDSKNQSFVEIRVSYVGTREN
jgi:hypothetical protein